MIPNNRGVYVLSCDSNKYYCGSTEYLQKRIYSHIHGYEFRGEKRFTAWTIPKNNQEGYLKKYTRLVSSASKGCVTC